MLLLRELWHILRGIFLIIRGLMRVLQGENLPVGAGMVAPIAYALLIAIGVPLMGWLITNTIVKLVITMLWYFVSIDLYWWVEVHEITTAIDDNGSLNTQRVNRQIKRLQVLWYGGVIPAVMIYLIFLAVAIALWIYTHAVLHLATQFFDFWYGPWYTVEGLILLRAALQWATTVDAINQINLEFLAALSGQRRIDVADQLAATPGWWRRLAS